MDETKNSIFNTITPDMASDKIKELMTEFLTKEGIHELTQDQERLRDEYRARYFKAGWSTERSERERAERAILGLYDLMNKKHPEFVWFDSPMAAIDTIKESGGSVDGLTGTDGCLDAFWVAYYMYCRTLGMAPHDFEKVIKGEAKNQDLASYMYKPEDDAQLLLWNDLVESTGPCFPFENYCLMTERPVKASYDDRELLHGEDGPALEYLDGEKVYAVNGVTILRDDAEQIVERPWEMTLEQITECDNEDTRTIMQALWCYEDIDGAGDRVGSGGGRWLKETGAKEIHADVYKAYESDDGKEYVSIMRALLADRDGHKWLMCSDSSTDRVYYIRADDDATTCEEAHRSFNGDIADADIVMSS